MSGLSLRIGSLLLLAAHLCGVPAHAQAPAILLKAERPCTSCLKLRPVTTLRGSGEITVGATTIIARNRRGQFLLTHVNEPAGLFLFGADGRPLRRIGRRGQGPGEFVSIRALEISAGDTIHVFDGQLQRVSILDPELNFVRTVPLPGPVNLAVVLPGGGYVQNGTMLSPDQVGLPLHLLDRAGRRLRSFGSADGAFDGMASWAGWRALGLSPRGSVWTLPFTSYQLEEWGLDGGLKRGFRRDPGWFEPYRIAGRLTPQNPPRPRSDAVWEDARGLVWTVIEVVDPDWRRHLQPIPSVPGAWQPTDLHRVFDTVIEVIDPGTGRLVASQRFRDLVLGTSEPGLLVRYREDAAGEPALDLYRVELER